MAGGRVLSPFFGSSLYQWASVIGVALLSYTVGYFYHVPLYRYGATPPLLAAALYTLLLPLWIVGALERFLILPLLPSTLLCSFLTIGPPSLLWASLTPHLQQQTAGTSLHAGSVLGVSTLGSLAGVFIVAFYLVPFLGLSKTLLALGSLGGVTALLAATQWQAATRAVVLLAAAAAVLVGLAAVPPILLGSTLARFEMLSSTSGVRSQLQLVEAKETFYQSYSLWTSGEGASPTLHFFMDGLQQFEWNEADDANAVPANPEYFHYAQRAFSWIPDPRHGHGLFIGLGGGLVPYLVQKQYPEARLQVVELDPDIASVVSRRLPLARLDRAANRPEIVVDDGRNFLRSSRETYDYIFLDAYVGTYIPHHLSTVEFFRLIRNHLNPGGVVVINVLSLLDSNGFLDRMEATVHAALPLTVPVDVPLSVNRVIFAFSEASRELPIDPASEMDKVTQTALAIHSTARERDRAAQLAVFVDDRDDIDATLFEAQKKLFEFKRRL